jgi:hypothetical protein
MGRENPLKQGDYVADFVDLTGAHGVVTEEAKGPAQRSLTLEELRVVLGLRLGHDLLIGELGGLGGDEAFLVVLRWGG